MGKKKLHQYYKYDWSIGHSGCLLLRGVSKDNGEANKISAEMNRITKYVWGLGLMANSIFNAHAAPLFQSIDKEKNIERAKMTAKIWRYCKRNNIRIAPRNKEKIKRLI